ncbi:uncharacterized protein LOC141658513 [Silene latifolia]|uniref:uncharacterized protein LOC141658513 n=1 Tax=Silene latifolia TaxID=37657 RepID=UPI003D77C310
MKVLNWVTRRFLNNVQSCIAVLPDEDMEHDHVNSKYDIDETKRPMLEDWEDSLLAIGTLAISPLETGNFDIIEEIENTNDLNYHNNLNYNDFEKTEENSLVIVTLFTHELEKKIIVAKTKTTQEQVINVVVDSDDNDDIKDEGQAMKRVTLGDLLLQESDHKLVKQLADNKQLHQANVFSKDVITMSKPSAKTIKPTFRAKRGLAKAKKLLKEDLNPMKKINQMMKRMMKTKIYPDMEGKIKQDMDMDMQSRLIVIGNRSNEDVGSNNQL